MGKLMRALGLMSGTSMDGIDVAMIETNGDDRVVRGPAMTMPYNSEQRAALAEALEHARSIVRRTDRPGNLPVVERMVTELHAAAVSAFVRKQKLDRATIGVIGFHGQTVLHKPMTVEVSAQDYKLGVAEQVTLLVPKMLTVQLGEGPRLAELTGLDVVHDLRASDCDAGGQGAPLVPVYHRALTAKLPDRPIAVVNIGGVANVTWIGRDGALIAFDTGPGNALIDDWMAKQTGKALDREGAAAAGGKVDDGLLRALLGHEHFALLPPKSLDRNAFASHLPGGLSTEDGAATLTAFTAAAIAKARAHFPQQPELWIISGGGRKNKTLMRMIAGHVENAVVPAEAAGLDGDAIEAEAWAYLAVRSLNGLPITFPGTTGVAIPMTGGVLTRAPAKWQPRFVD